MTENKSKKFVEDEQAEELSLEDCGRVAGGFGGHGGDSGYIPRNPMFPDDINNGSAKKGAW